jgi:RHS repeat-associated protein
MGRPAAKKGDKIISMTPGDIHIVQPPFGPPVPLPHPCKSDIKMKLAKQVNVQGKAGAVKGSRSKHMPPHFPTPPGVSFVRPPKNEAEVFTGSSNVNYEGRAAAMLGDTGLMCADPVDTPVGVLVVPPGTVYVGGGITGGAEARAQAKIAAMKAAAAHCHQWINNNMPLGADREEAHRKVCEDTGHPVDVATGKMFTGVTILQLRGRIPVRLAIDYSTARAQEDGPFGHGWRHELERHLLITDDFVAHRNQHGHFAAFEPIGPGEEAQNLSEGLTLSHHGHYLAVRDAHGLEDVFLLPEGYQKGWMLPLAGMRDAFQNAVRLHYQDRRLARITDSAGREVQLTYGSDNRVIQVLLKDDPQVAPQPIVTCRYDRTGDLIAVGDPLGHERRFAYDHHLLVQETDRNGFSFYFTYDEAQRCVLTWGDGGKLYRRLAYDPERQLSHVIDSYGGQTLHRLSPSGTVEDTVDPLGREWSKTYDDNGLLLAETDPTGRSWTYSYDEAGRLTERSDPWGDSCELVYDDAGRVVSARYSQGIEIAVRHDPKTGKPIAKRFGEEGPEQRFVWSDRGDLEEVQQAGVRLLRFRRDGRGLVEEIDAGRFYLTRRFDDAGRLVETIDGRGNSSIFTYDERGEIATERRAGSAVRQFTYDGETNLSRIDQDGRSIEYDYGILDTTTGARGNWLRQNLSFVYDAENRLAGIVNGRGARHAFVYDAGGRPAARHYPDGSVARFSCDDEDQPETIIDRAGRVIHLTYDRFGNCCQATYPDGQEIAWEFENGTDLASHQTSAVRCATERNDAGVAIGESFAFHDGPRITLVRDDQGFLTFSDDPLRAAVVGQADGRPLGASCNAWSGPLRYRAAHGQVAARYPSGVIEAIKLDGAGRRREQIITGRDRRVINRRRLIYDDAGQLVGVDDELRGQQRFVFDLAGRLRAVRRPSGDDIERYEYDEAENLSRDGERWQFDLADRLVERPGHSYAYDACGNCIEHREHGRGTTRFTYDGRNRLVRVERPDGDGIEYAYDGLGRRVRKRVGDSETLFLWNGDLLAAERHADGGQRTYLYHRKSHHLIGWVDRDAQGTRCYFVHSDHLGRPQEVTDEQGRLVWAVDYDAFGAIRRVLVAEVECPFRSAGQYADAETGLYYNRSRYFDPATARYMSEDPTGLAGGINLYGYCPNPYADMDFYGEQWVRNPNYDPEAARRELELMRRIYNESPALQWAHSADFDPNNPEHLARLQQMFEQETRMPCQDWTQPFYYRDEQGQRQLRQVGRTEDDDEDDLGAVQWDATEGGPRVLITPNDPTTNEPLTGEERRDALVHEYNSVKLVQAQTPPNYHPTTGAARAYQQPTQFSEVDYDMQGNPSPGQPVYNTHMMDNYARSPQSTEGFYADQQQDWEDEPTQVTGPPDFDE